MYKIHKENHEEMFETNTHIYSLLHIRSTPLGPGLLCLAKLLFNRPARGILTKLSRQPVLINTDGNHYAALIKRQPSADIVNDNCRNIPILYTGQSVEAHCKDKGP